MPLICASQSMASVSSFTGLSSGIVSPPRRGSTGTVHHHSTPNLRSSSLCESFSLTNVDHLPSIMTTASSVLMGSRQHRKSAGYTKWDMPVLKAKPDPKRSDILKKLELFCNVRCYVVYCSALHVDLRLLTCRTMACERSWKVE